MGDLTHFDAQGQAHMVDVGEKAETQRVAVATGRVSMQPDTLRRIVEGRAAKGDVLGIARIAAIQGAKRTADLVPLCHPLPLTHVSVEFVIDEAASAVDCVVRAETHGRTGVEMEALTGATVAALAVYDMCKALSHAIVIGPARLVGKRGGKRDVGSMGQGRP